MNITKEIQSQLEIIGDSIAWAEKHNKEGFPKKQFKQKRRDLKRILFAFQENCSAAAYGESQVGKSYLMSSLLSSPQHPFRISNGEETYSFIDDLNCSGGSHISVESTGVVTRFTIQKAPSSVRKLVRVSLLSITDIILIFVDSYYNDLRLDATTLLGSENISSDIANLISRFTSAGCRQDYLTEDDIYEVESYLKENFASHTQTIRSTSFFSLLAENIQHIRVEDWGSFFELLWNKEKKITQLFNGLISAYQQLGFRQTIFLPFETLLHRNGTLLDIGWLDIYCGGGTPTLLGKPQQTPVFDESGSPIADEYSKAALSALIAEVTFHLPEELADDRPFLRKIDLLDFPGARARKMCPLDELEGKDLSVLIKRGKVAYLFSKYSNASRISSVLFCQHQDKGEASSLCPTITHWIDSTIGGNPAERTRHIQATNNVSPLFIVATKFNKSIAINDKVDSPNDTDTLNAHWDLFNIVLPEILTGANWYDNYVLSGTTGVPFRYIYPLRDFYWSERTGIFAGYDANGMETPIRPQGYPNYFEALRESFVNNENIQRHFSNPGKSWDDSATPQHDGSQPIINDLTRIAEVLDTARKRRYLEELKSIKDYIVKTLISYWIPDNEEDLNKELQRVVGDMRMKIPVNVGKRPEVFGRIIDSLMIPSSTLREIAFNVLFCHTAGPIDLDAIAMIRFAAGINLNESREKNEERLLKYVSPHSLEQADQFYKEQGFSIEDILSERDNLLTTTSGVITDLIVKSWAEYISSKIPDLEALLPHPDKVVQMLQTLLNRLGVKKQLAQGIEDISKLFSLNDRPNAIGDYATLTLNDFVSTVGRDRLTDAILVEAKEKVKKCELAIEINETTSTEPRNTSITQALKVFNQATDIEHIPFEVLTKLPFWNNFDLWLKQLQIGLVLASDVTDIDPVANGQIKSLISQTNQLFND